MRFASIRIRDVDRGIQSATLPTYQFYAKPLSSKVCQPRFTQAVNAARSARDVSGRLGPSFRKYIVALRGSMFSSLGRKILMNKVRLASLALAAFAVSFGSFAMADCGGRQGLLAKMAAKKEAGCNGGGLIAKIKAKMASRCGGAPSCCAPAPTCCAPAPTCCEPAPTCCAPAPTCCAPAPEAASCGCAAPAAPACGCAAPVSNCGCGAAMNSYVSAPAVSSGCSSCGTTLNSGVISSSTVVPPAPAAPAAPAAPVAPASVSDKAPAA